MKRQREQYILKKKGFYFTVSSRALKKVIYLACVLILLGVAGWGLCLYDHAKQEGIRNRELVDSLNDLSYDYCFRQLDSSYVYAYRAMKRARNYSSGMCEAMNNLMYICYLRMNYEDGYNYYRKIQETTKNQIQLLISEINMMKLCQQTSENRLFFDYYNRALERMKRITEEYNTLDERNKKNFAYAQIEFRLTAASNYFFLMQTAQAINEINQIPEEGEVRNDLVLWIYYCYLRGLGRLFDGLTYDERLLKSFDYLMIAHQTSLQYHYIFFEARSLHALANLLDNDYNYTLIKKERPHVITYLKNAYVKDGDETEPAGKRNESLILALADEGLKQSKIYNSILLTGRAYYVIGSIRFNRGEYGLALDAFETSLSYINLHHRQCYPNDRGPFLSLFSNDSVSVDMKWIADPHMKTLPIMLATLRERLSATFSALDDKQKSDYNRNLYLDLLEIARQDKSLESKYEHVEKNNKWLMTVMLVVTVIMVIAWISLFMFARLWKKRNKIRISLLNSLHDWFSHMPDVSPMHRLDEMIKDYPWMRREKKVMQDMLLPYMDWIEKNRSLTAEIHDDMEQIKEQRMLSEYRIEDNKRKNISKRAKVTLVNSIMPYVDRILNEVHRILKSKASLPQRLAYVEEITDKINNCNDVLTQWIQMHRGEVNLAIETFPLQQLFDIIKKSNYNFVQKNIRLDIRPTVYWVRADKALTLFMINTLADNARKFTPAGGFVRIEANEQDGAVEISVTDTGCGLTEEEISLILSSKIYDASLIGEKNDKVQKEKGHGFGLMNCKGIIEKYRKLNKIFEVCRFDIQSQKGKGSRFFFRLPKGEHFSKMTMILLLLCGSSSAAVASGSSTDRNVFINRATSLADSVYFANISGEHHKAIVFADSALSCLNRYYAPSLPLSCQDRQLRLEGFGSGEQEWWNAGVRADYNLIMALRNEIAVAALALHLWNVYTYNNLQYTHMYRLNSQNYKLENDLVALMRLQKNMNIGVVFMIIIILILVILIYIIYFRRRMMFRFNVMQVLDINHSIFESANRYNRQTQIDVMTKDWLEIVRKGINEIHEIEGVALLLYKENEECLGTYTDGAIPHLELTKTLLKNVYRKRTASFDEMINTKAYPLLFHQNANETICVGSLAINYGKYQQTKNEVIFEEFIVSYLSIMIYEVIVKHRHQWEMLEMENDEKQRALYEETRLRVQNQIMDNCLSTIKHEAMYYPSRIKQIVRRIRETDNTDDIMSQVNTLNELAEYYKEIYTLLASQLERQLSFIYFKFTDVDVKRLMERWFIKTQKYVDRRNLSIPIKVESVEGQAVISDEVLTDFLLKNMTTFCLERLTEKCLSAELKLSAVVEENFIKFMLYLSVELYTQEETTELFDSEQGNYGLLICKEIIRIHDKLNNYCGCRINIETIPERGTYIWCTIPKSEKKYDKTI